MSRENDHSGEDPVRVVAGSSTARSFTLEQPEDLRPLAFHRRLPGYAPTRLRELPSLARELGVAQVLVKDESSRLGLPAFKMLGASWACYRALFDRAGIEPTWTTLEDLGEWVATLGPVRFVTATDGNHGRAVARMGRLIGVGSDVLVPMGTVPARIRAIEDEGATVSVIEGNYDAAVAAAAAQAGPHVLVVSDTSWPGYEATPLAVVEGYATIFEEIEAGLKREGWQSPTLMAVQMGVGAFAAAAVRHYRSASACSRPALLGVEPTNAACVLASVEAGHPVTLAGQQDSIMAGLNCGTPSMLAWPLLSQGMDAFCAISDDAARRAMRELARVGVEAGESGAAGWAGVVELVGSDAPAAAQARNVLGLDAGSRVLVVCTEGATDPEAYREIVGTEGVTNSNA